MKRFFAAAFTVFAIALAPTGAAEPRISRGVIDIEPGLRAAVLAESLNFPWGMDWLPDGAMLITERTGRLRPFRNGALAPDAIAFPVAVTAGGDGGITRGQGGLMDVAVDPNFARNRLVYFTYSEGDASANRTAVARTRLDANRLSRFQRLFANADSKTRGQHFGSRLLFLPDGSLLVSIGDGGNPPISFAGADIRQQAQNVRTHFGKVLRLNPDGSVPRDNPLRTTEGARPEIWSFGHRNVQGLARDPETGAVWASEHGAAAGDEINRLEAGANYGWPAVTFARNYFDGSLISTETRREGMQDPVVVWLDTHSPSGLAVYRGQEFPQLRGALLSGGLITQDIRVIRPQPAGRARETRIPIGARVRDVAIGPDGRIYILTDGESARLLRIESSGAHSS